jgi:predicted enzyme related to lactoylglutathione lyase
MRVTGIDHVQLVRDLATLVAALRSKGHEIVPADGVPGCFRVHVFDPFGNRIELMEPSA